MNVFGIVGRSGSGKTTLISLLIREFKRRGLSVSAIKRVPDSFDFDRRGKDSFRLRESGCAEVLVSSNTRSALLIEHAVERKFKLDLALNKLDPVDIVLVEGFSHLGCKSIEVYRPSLGKEPLFQKLNTVRAVATDDSGIISPLPLLDINATTQIADFLLKQEDFCDFIPALTRTQMGSEQQES